MSYYAALGSSIAKSGQTECRLTKQVGDGDEEENVSALGISHMNNRNNFLWLQQARKKSNRMYSVLQS